MKDRKDLLETAINLTYGDRAKDYGSPVENMNHIASIYNSITGQSVSGSNVAQFMIAVKLARRSTSPTKADHYIDDMAYTGIEYECALAEAGTPAEYEAIDGITTRIKA